MTPVFQTKFPPQHPHGNCLAAVVATLFDQKIEEVPNFEVIQVGTGKLWLTVLGEWFNAKGLFLQLAPHELLTYHNHGGKFPHSVTTAGGYTNVPYIGSGTVAGQQHVAIYANGKLVHDPTPGGAGLDVFDEVWIMRTKLDPPLGGLHVGDWFRLDNITYSTVPQPADY